MIRKRLEEWNIVLPPSPAPVANYAPAILYRDFLFVSGQLPFSGVELLAQGPLKTQDDVEPGKKAMEQCFLNALAAAGSIVDLDSIKKVLKLTAFVASYPEFRWHHLVANGASDLAVKIFGEQGLAVRTTIGVVSLPLNASVELEVVFAL